MMEFFSSGLSAYADTNTLWTILSADPQKTDLAWL